MKDLIQALLRPGSLVQIAVLSVLFYVVLSFVRGTRGANILKALLFLFGLSFLGLMVMADFFGLDELKTLLTWLLNGSAIALIIIFAPELRRGLSRIAQSPLLSPLLRGQSGEVVDELVNAAVKLSKNRIGALVAIERDVALGDIVENGVKIDAALTSELLETLFYPGSALHDGAVVVQHDRVAAAACLFPLTDDPTLSKSMGTRHRAALGLSEETDAIALIVSEETGRISVAVKGKLTGDLNRESLQKLLNELYAKRDRPTLAAGRPAKAEAAAAPPPSPPGNGSGNGHDQPSVQPAPQEEKSP